MLGNKEVCPIKVCHRSCLLDNGDGNNLRGGHGNSNTDSDDANNMKIMIPFII